MYVLYIDESGNESNPADRHFVMAGLAVFERQIHYLNEALDRIQEEHFPGSQPIPFHASPIRKGKDFWRRVEEERRERIMHQLGEVLSKAHSPGVVLFGVAVEKSADLYGEAAVERAVEEICGRFNRFLVRLHRNQDTQRGLLVFAEGRFDSRAATWVKTFRSQGTRIGNIRNFAEDLPYFASANDSRLLQLADYVAHSLFLEVEQGNSQYMNAIRSRFDFHENVMHGLKVIRRQTK